jgi:hypothetical protein
MNQSGYLKDVGNKSITIVTTIFPQTPPNDKNIDANVTTVNEFWEKYIDIAQIPLTIEKVPKTSHLILYEFLINYFIILSRVFFPILFINEPAIKYPHICTPAIIIVFW